MTLTEQLKHMLNCFQPQAYKRLSTLSMSTILKRYFVAFLVSLILLSIIALPTLVSLPARINQGLSSFETFTIDFDVQAPQAITISTSPLIVIDLDKDEPTQEFLLFTNKSIHYKPYVWFGTTSTNWTELQDVPAQAQRYTWLLIVVAILLLPSFVLTLFLFVLLESLLIATLAWIVLSIGLRITRYDISSKHILKIVILALTPFMLIQLLPLAYHRWFIVPFIVYLVLCLFAAWLCAEKSVALRVHKKQSRKSNQ